MRTLQCNPLNKRKLFLIYPRDNVFIIKRTMLKKGSSMINHILTNKENEVLHDKVFITDDGKHFQHIERLVKAIFPEDMAKEILTTKLEWMPDNLAITL